ncbi:MAG: hypothetical protein ABWJ42_01810 [Sulfolobales archaeon]
MSIRFSRFLDEGIDRLFYCWARVKKYEEGVDEEFISCKPSDFWVFSGRESRYTEFVESYYMRPEGYVTVSLRSRDLFRYGLFELRVRLPRVEGGPLLWFGFELEDLFGGGCIHFGWDTSRGELRAVAGGFISRVEMNLTKYLPERYSEEYNLYRIIRRRDLALWYINERLRAVAILGAGDVRDSKILYEEKPYYISVLRDTPALSLPVLLDIDAGDYSKPFEWRDLHPWNLRVAEIDPDTKIYLDLYAIGGEQRLTGSKVRERIISAPIPGGADRVNIVFTATGRGDLVIESSSGDQWREYDRIFTSPNKRIIVRLSEPQLMYRIIFEPHQEAIIEEAYSTIV